MGNKLTKSRKKIDKPTPTVYPNQPVRPLRRSVEGNTSVVYSNFPRIVAELHHYRGSVRNLEDEDEEDEQPRRFHEEVHCCVFSPDDEALLLTSTTPIPCGPFTPDIGCGHLREFDINSGSCKRELLTYHSQECDISSDGNLVSFITNSGQGEVALVKRNRSSYAEIAERVDKFQPCCNGMTGQTLCCKFSPDARHIVSAASLDFHSMRETNELRLWNVKSMQIEARVVLRDITDFCGFVTRCEFSPDGQYLAVSTSKEQLCILRSKNLDVVTVLRRRCRGNVCWSIFNPAWRFEVLACCMQDGRVEIWNKVEVHSSAHAGELRYAREKERKVSFSRLLHCCQYSPDGKMIAVGTSDANIIMLGAETLDSLFYLECIKEPSPFGLRIQNTIVYSIAFSKSQQYVAAGYSDSMVRVWAMPMRFDLQHLCRVVILHSVPGNKINSLPVPNGIKNYLLNNYK